MDHAATGAARAGGAAASASPPPPLPPPPPKAKYSITRSSAGSSSDASSCLRTHAAHAAHARTHTRSTASDVGPGQGRLPELAPSNPDPPPTNTHPPPPARSPPDGDVPPQQQVASGGVFTAQRVKVGRGVEVVGSPQPHLQRRGLPRPAAAGRQAVLLGDAEGHRLRQQRRHRQGGSGQRKECRQRKCELSDDPQQHSAHSCAKGGERHLATTAAAAAQPLALR